MTLAGTSWHLAITAYMVLSCREQKRAANIRRDGDCGSTPIKTYITSTIKPNSHPLATEMKAIDEGALYLREHQMNAIAMVCCAWRCQWAGGEMGKWAGNMKHDHSNDLNVGINSTPQSGPQAQLVENNRRNIPLGATLTNTNHFFHFWHLDSHY